jgi:hypothetical protein
MKLTSLMWMVCAIVCTILMSACGSSSSDPPAASGPLSGNWQMTFQPTSKSFTPTQSGFLLEDLGTNGATITGTMMFSVGECSGVGSVTGTADAANISIQESPAGLNVQLTGTMTSSPTAMNGNYTILSDGCAGPYSAPQSGTWTAALVPPLSGNLSGTFTAKKGAIHTMAGQISQGTNTGISSASLSGTITTTDYCFFSSASLVGSISGTAVALNIVSSTGTQLGQIVGTTDGTTVTGTYNMLAQGTGATKPCNDGEGGQVSLAF